MSDLLREIDEDVAKEKSEQFLEKWGLPIGVFIVILVVGLFFYFNWQNRVEQAALDEADAFSRAVEEMGISPETSVGLLEDLSDSSSGFQELADFKSGDALWASGDQEGAIAAWLSYVEDATNNPHLINATRFKLAWFGSGLLARDQVIAEIEALEVIEAYAPYGPVLRALDALVGGNKAEALSLLDSAITDETPELVRELATAVRGLANTI